MKKIIHIIPAKTMGGVEMAAETAKNIKSKNFNFEIIYLSIKKYKFAKSLFSFFDILMTTKKIINKNPDFIIVSLWKSCLSAYILSIFKPEVKIILFLHLTKSTNIVDFFISKIISKKAFQIWSDSEKTNSLRSNELKIDPKRPRKIISFIRYKLDCNKTYNLEPNFIFWGRIHKQKRLDKAITLFHSILKTGNNDCKFLIIGPDCGDLSNLKKLVKKLKINKYVFFQKEKNFKEILKISKNYSFFLQLSDYEGMGMSVIESMQLGLVPIITEVGEINSYCKHNINSIVFQDFSNTSIEIINLIKQKDIYENIRLKAIQTWKSSLTYEEDLKNNLELISN